MQFSEVKYQPEQTMQFLGSPALIRAKDGALLASFDYFDADWEKNLDPRLTDIYRSEDDGVTWNQVCSLVGAFWGVFFEVGNALYHISVSREYGDVVIRRSDDCGFTWSIPRDKNSGILFQGGPRRQRPNYHFGGTTPVLIHNGRIYKACENFCDERDGGFWHADAFREMVISAPIDADLLDADSWSCSNEIVFEPEKYPDITHPESGWLEGNILMRPDGSLCNVMRAHLKESNRAFLLDVSSDGSEISFDGTAGVVCFPGGASKFTVRRDPKTGLYFTLSNPIRDSRWPNCRNVLALSVSSDLIHWRELCDLLSDDTGYTPELSAQLTGFQYTDWVFDGDDLIYLVRMAYRGSRNFHDSNRLGFFRLKNFRTLVG
jgi:hypothetical protein